MKFGRKSNKKCKMLGPLEYKVMSVLWNLKKPLNCRQILENLSLNYSYTTIMTVLKRMFDKNIVTRVCNSHTYFYFPTMPKKKFIDKCLDHLFHNLFKCYGAQVVERFHIAAKKAKYECQNI